MGSAGNGVHERWVSQQQKEETIFHGCWVFKAKVSHVLLQKYVINMKLPIYFNSNIVYRCDDTRDEHKIANCDSKFAIATCDHFS